MPARRSWFAPVFVALTVAGACGDSGGPSVPSGVVVVSGGGQSGHISLPLAQPLVVRVTGAGGASFPGATVAWTVTSGSATLAPVSSQSDADGRATTIVTLGATPGAVVVSASTSGLNPVTFTLTAVGPQTLTRTAGDNQTGPVGGQLPESLQVSVVGTDGLPYAGATVTWNVAGGAGTPGPALVLTDGDGLAATSVTLATAGDLTVTAAVVGVPPVSFAATAVPPCAYVAPYVLGQTVNAALTAFDCLLNLGGASYYYDFYALDLPAQQSLSVSMSSTAFDTWLDLFRITGLGAAFNDDSAAGNENSHIEAILGGGSYVIGPSSLFPVTTGSYVLRSATRPATISGCRVIWIAGLVTVGETVLATDCVDASSGSTFYSDRVALTLDAGSLLRIHLQSAAQDPLVYLYDVDLGSVVATNDDSAAGTTTAFIEYVAPAASTFIIDLGTAVAGQTGAYTLSITGTGLAAAAGVRAAGEADLLRVPLERLRGPGTKGSLDATGMVRARLPNVRGKGPRGSVP